MKMHVFNHKKDILTKREAFAYRTIDYYEHIDYYNFEYYGYNIITNLPSGSRSKEILIRLCSMRAETTSVSFIFSHFPRILFRNSSSVTTPFAESNEATSHP